MCDATTDGLTISTPGVTLDLGGHTISGPGAYTTSFSGVRVTGVPDVTVTRGTITGFQSGVVFNEADDGFITKISAHGNDQGINLSGHGGHLVAQNVVADNGRDAIALGESDGNTITQNVVTGNTFGIFVRNGSDDNVVTRNKVSATHSVGIATYDRANRTVVAQNTVWGNWDDGIRIGADTSGSTLLQNTSYGNGGDGIEVSNATVTKNTATYNGQLGIRALAGATDGGGNKAAYNGDPAQCAGVVCGMP